MRIYFLVDESTGLFCTAKLKFLGFKKKVLITYIFQFFILNVNIFRHFHRLFLTICPCMEGFYPESRTLRKKGERNRREHLLNIVETSSLVHIFQKFHSFVLQYKYLSSEINSQCTKNSQDINPKNALEFFSLEFSCTSPQNIFKSPKNKSMFF